MKRLTVLFVVAWTSASCAESASSSSPVTVCGTATAPGFIGIEGIAPATPSGSAPHNPGAEVLAEIGSTYVAIGSSCDFWSYSAIGPTGNAGGVLYQGRLTPEQVADVDALLRLESWTDVGPVHGICCVFDFAPSSYHWGTRTLGWFGTPDLVGPPPLPEGFPHDPTTLHSDLHGVLSTFGAPAAGPVRYTAIELVDPGPESVYLEAPSWPLEIPISELSVTEDELFGELPAPVHRADGEAAVRLRELRAAAIGGDFGNLERRGAFTPIQEPDGSQYKLYLRDVGSIEAPEGVPKRDPLAL